MSPELSNEGAFSFEMVHGTSVPMVCSLLLLNGSPWFEGPLSPTNTYEKEEPVVRDVTQLTERLPSDHKALASVSSAAGQHICDSSTCGGGKRRRELKELSSSDPR